MTVSFACQPEVSLKEAEQLLESLRSWCQKNGSIEIVVNDWGIAQLVGRYPEQFELCMGTLLNKRKKDPRLSYLKSRLPDKDTGLLAENSLNADFYQKALEKSLGFVRYEWESCGYPQKSRKEKTACIFRFIKRTHRNTVPFMRSAESTTGDGSIYRRNVPDIVRCKRFYTRSICI